MSSYEVEQPILNSPYEEPAEYWHIEEGKMPEIKTGRRFQKLVFELARDLTRDYVSQPGCIVPALKVRLLFILSLKQKALMNLQR